jgi:hypothetical protein
LNTIILDPLLRTNQRSNHEIILHGRRTALLSSARKYMTVFSFCCTMYRIIPIVLQHAKSCVGPFTACSLMVPCKHARCPLRSHALPYLRQGPHCSEDVNILHYLVPFSEQAQCIFDCFKSDMAASIFFLCRLQVEASRRKRYRVVNAEHISKFSYHHKLPLTTPAISRARLLCHHSL